LSGQPWLNTTGCPVPQSLEKVCVPSAVVVVPINLPLVVHGLPGSTLSAVRLLLVSGATLGGTASRSTSHRLPA
jgi:hypothetical protein